VATLSHFVNDILNSLNLLFFLLCLKCNNFWLWKLMFLIWWFVVWSDLRDLLHLSMKFFLLPLLIIVMEHHSFWLTSQRRIILNCFSRFTLYCNRLLVLGILLLLLYIILLKVTLYNLRYLKIVFSTPLVQIVMEIICKIILSMFFIDKVVIVIELLLLEMIFFQHSANAQHLFIVFFFDHR